MVWYRTRGWFRPTIGVLRSIFQSCSSWTSSTRTTTWKATPSRKSLHLSIPCDYWIPSCIGGLLRKLGMDSGDCETKANSQFSAVWTCESQCGLFCLSSSFVFVFSCRMNWILIDARQCQQLCTARSGFKHGLGIIAPECGVFEEELLLDERCRTHIWSERARCPNHPYVIPYAWYVCILDDKLSR